MGYSIREIAAALGADAMGDVDLIVDEASEPAAAGPRALALAMNPKYADGLATGAAQAAILWPGADWQVLGLRAAIVVPRPRVAMSGLTRIFDPGPQIGKGIHPTAVIDPGADIGAGARIGPFVVVAAGVRIGPNARIASHVSIAEGARIGDDALILQGARIGARVVIGDRFICQPGAVIGGDGFSFVTPEKSGVEQVRETLGARENIQSQGWMRIHSLGSVQIGDDVEIGTNAAVDRGTIRSTMIGNGTKLDNLVHLGHNVQVGKDCLICGQVGVAGSVRIGDRVVLAGQVGVNDNIFIGDDVIAGGASKIFTNVPAGRVLLGYPAVKMDSHIEMQKALRRLPRLSAAVAALQKAISKPDAND
ncbi:MAG: UDP-3-O-(3-hydroxymyristoyl)glucosamine N-acyltransferase [Cereibacter sphaeroides]|uniref:UDP-3-O-acylglucosamine N-acyltransferase n=1 Tax=Cereibacter sphaeroides TaxID=1063 RepID=A0A2W5SEW9_CERSP|nr:MAG: UDP-3-O-(3-hydroxymyristoyl)glucosamine N-acyltransferase [Cereibacter sphaeroides]